MRRIRKQLQLVSALGETILCYRLEPSEGLTDHLNKIFLKIKTMAKANQFEDDISEMLVSKQNYQIQNKFNILRVQNISQVEKYLLQIKINVYEKGTGLLFNSQKWEFVISFTDNHTHSITYPKEGIVCVMEFVLKNLLYLNILPLNKNLRNKYMIDHKVAILPSESNIQLSIYENIACREFGIGKCDNKLNGKVTVKYFYNESKIQQNIKEIVNERFKTSLESSKKYSITSTECSNCRISFYEHYDDELDITVLSSADLGNENKQLQLDDEEEEFQLLIEESQELTDEDFLSKNTQLFKQLITNGYDYL